MKGKFRPGASDEERKSGYRDIMREKGTQPKKDGKFYVQQRRIGSHRSDCK